MPTCRTFNIGAESNTIKEWGSVGANTTGVSTRQLYLRATERVDLARARDTLTPWTIPAAELAVEEHEDNLRIHSQHISELRSEVKELQEIAGLLAEAVIAQTVLTMGGGPPFSLSDQAKANQEKLRTAAVEIKKRFGAKKK